MSLVEESNTNGAYTFWAYSDVRAGNSGLRVLEFEFDEAAAHDSDSERLVQLRITFEEADSTHVPLETAAVFPGCTVLIDEGF